MYISVDENIKIIMVSGVGEKQARVRQCKDEAPQYRQFNSVSHSVISDAL